ncbi:bifunctional diguanylate cyclase/phosphodiesterase [Methylobacillus arboreus]|uniref:putative bifunctional diguanylate cyclase/phosphodiesterase n=1 Tax=Methylobacillus arboreus TaxID=755170 RepID=UPI001E298E66|nr:EAL domain-containing protein [Methylobacillus arboreus]MCB5189402.1 bifunctional diguanylate cyclase/phosphodiesterase [Methylobacillus arboreus]
MTGSYDYRLVLLSIAIAFISSLAAFMFTNRVARNQGGSAKAWMALGAVTMGSGIWAMHFISMMAWSLPTPMGYMLDDTALSWLIAVSVSWLALDIASRPGLNWQVLLAAGIVMGLGISGMHYSGMHAMQMFPEISYDRTMLALSVGVAIIASILALAFMFQAGNHAKKHSIGSQLFAAAVMTGGIAGTHFTGMAAAEIHPNAVCTSVSTLQPGLFSVIIALGICTLILIASILAIIDSRNDDRANWLLADTQGKLSRMNMLDTLTQLPNHRYFQQHLSIGIRRTSRLGTALAVAIIKLDNLKSVKQSLGQHISDEVLRTAAKRIQDTIRGCDMAAYNGTEEFLVLFEDIQHEDDILPVMERIMQSLNATFRIDRHDITLDVRAGISLYPKHGDADRLLTYAEAAMHRVQADDNHGFRLFDNRLETSSFDLLEIQQALRHALTNQEMALYFEPRMDILGNTITGLEIQVRWLHPTKGAIPAATFAPMAENLGLIEDISDWILEQSYRTIQQLHQQQIHLPMYLPLMPAQLRSSGLEQRIAALANQFSLPADALILEVAESAFMQQPEHYVDFLERLPAVSLKISLENFGTRFSSLPYLQHLNLKLLKLDRSFTQELITNQKSRAIAGAIIELAHAQNLKVAAENVSNEDERNALLSLECNEIQGFFCANPIHQEQLLDLLISTKLSSQKDKSNSRESAWLSHHATLSGVTSSPLV